MGSSSPFVLLFQYKYTVNFRYHDATRDSQIAWRLARYRTYYELVGEDVDV
jgi:hypothetical protein